MQINLAKNRLCGLDYDGRGTYSVEGVKAIADAMHISGNLTSINLDSNQLGAAGGKVMAQGIRISYSVTSIGADGLQLKYNRLGVEGWSAIFAAVCGSSDSKIALIDASGEVIGVEGALRLSQLLQGSVSPSLAHVILSHIGIEDEGANALRRSTRSMDFKLELT